MVVVVLHSHTSEIVIVYYSRAAEVVTVNLFIFKFLEVCCYFGVII